MMKIKLENKN